MFRLVSLSCNRLWSRSGQLSNSFHGFTHFLFSRNCHVALLQEVNTPAAPSLPEDQPFQFHGAANTRGRNTAFLVHEDRSAFCKPVEGITYHNDICWKVFVCGEACASTAIASFYAPHVGCPEPERLSFWQRLSDSIGEITHSMPGIDIVLAGDSNLWVPGLMQNCGERSADRGCLEILRLIIRAFGLVICNPTGRPTHTRGDALDLVIASPGVVESVHVHNPQCDCEDSNLCCPLLASDHFAIEINHAIDLAAEFRRPVPTLQDVPPFLRAAVRHALMLALRELRTAYEAGTDHSYTATERAWKLFLLAPRMLLARPAHKQGPRGREELLARAAASERGRVDQSTRERPPVACANRITSQIRRSARSGTPGAGMCQGAHRRGVAGSPSFDCSGARTGHGRLLPRPYGPRATAPSSANTNPARGLGTRSSRSSAAICMGRRNGIAGSTQRRCARAFRHAR